MSNMQHNFPGYERSLSAHYSDVRRRLGVRPAKPFYFRPPPPKPKPVFSAPPPPPPPPPEHLWFIPQRRNGTLYVGQFLDDVPLKDRIKATAMAVAERVEACPGIKVLSFFPPAVGEVFGLEADLILSNCRKKYAVVPRQIGQTLALFMTRKSTTEVGRAFNRDHSTVIHARDKWAELVAEALAEIAPLEAPVTAQQIIESGEGHE